MSRFSSNSLRVQVIKLEKGAPEHFLFCGTLPRSANFGALETENRVFCKILGGKKGRFGCSDMVPPPLDSIQRETMPAPHNLPASADLTTVAVLAVIKPDDVSAAASDADIICHIVILTNSFILLVESSGMDECRFHSHFDRNRQEESSHCCRGCGLLFHSQLSKKLSELAGDDGFTPVMLPSCLL